MLPLADGSEEGGGLVELPERYPSVDYLWEGGRLVEKSKEKEKVHHSA